jgi:Trk K+ transport system NAD-binding subunit
MPETKRFLIHGLSRLTVRVANTLTEEGASVTVLRHDNEGGDLLSSLPPAVHVVTVNAEKYDRTLIEAGVAGADCLLALGDDDLANLRAGVAAQAVAGHVPVVLRTFDPIFADQLEIGLNVRRAYSVSALAAPAFIAAAGGSDVLETLRLGTGEVPICRLTVRGDSSLVGLTAAELKAGHHCAWLARAGADGGWRASEEGQGERPLAAGDQVLVGGLLPDVLRLSCRNAGWLPVLRRRRRDSGATHAQSRSPAGSQPRHLTLLPIVAAILSVFLLVAVFVFGHALKLGPIDSLYFVVTTATTTGYGDYSLKDTPSWLKLFGCGVMLAGGALFGILFSHLAALTTAERLEEVVGRRARRMENHIVVAGLGNVGFRVAQYLADIGLGVVVVDQTPSPRFASSLRVPVLHGDVRQTDSLERAAVGRAMALIACTSDDLANIQACLHAQRCRPEIVTVARVYDDIIAERLTQTFKITRSLSASQSATRAFVGAALDERAFRPLHVGDLPLLAYRFAVHAVVPEETIRGWRTQGIRLLAYRSSDGALHAPSELRGALLVGTEAILCGPSDAIHSQADLSSRN